MSVLSCDSDSLAEDWQDLSKSDYAKVIFHNKHYDPESGDVKCHFKLTDSVNKNVSDYIGLYKVGYENLSQCLAFKPMSELNFDEDGKTYECVFKSEDVSELNGFFQFLYVTHDKEVFGASMPFLVNNTKYKEGSPNNSLTTEKVEDGFLMVRYNLEQKNQLLETIVEKERQEKTALVNLCEQLKKEKEGLVHELEMVKSESTKKLFVLDNRLEEIKIELETNKVEKVNLSHEIEYITSKYCEISHELETIKKEFENVSSQLKSAEKEISKTNESKKELEKKVVSLLIYLNLVGKEELLSTENSYESEMEAVKAKFDQLIGKLDISVLERNELKHELSVINEKKVQLAEELKNYEITCARLAVEMESQAVSPKPTSEKENACQENKSSGIGGTEAAENQKLEFGESLENILKENQKLKDELKQLYFRLQMKCTRENLLASYDKGEMTSDAVFLAEQLDDAKYMIQALEDSKQLVIMEMNDVNKKLTKVTEQLCELKCENMLFKVNLEKAISSKASLDRIKNNIIEMGGKLKKSDMVNKMNDIGLKEKLETLHLFDKDIESKNELENSREASCDKKKFTMIDLSDLYDKEKESKNELENSELYDKDIESKNELENLRDTCHIKKKFTMIDLSDLNDDGIEPKNELENCTEGFPGKKKFFAEDKSHFYQESIESLNGKEIVYRKYFKVRNIEEENIGKSSKDDEQNNIITLKKASEKLREDLEEKRKMIMELITKLEDKKKDIELKKELEKSSMDDKNDIELKKELEILREDCHDKDRNIDKLKKEMKIMHASKISMQDSVNEMIARLKDAEELYRKLYMEKLKLSKKLKKVMSKTTSSAASSNVSTTDKSESCYLPINIDVLKESTSANSDSDTGEHVRAMVNTDKADANLQADASDFSEEMPFPTGCPVKTNFDADPVASTVTNDLPHDNDPDLIEMENQGVSCTICNAYLWPADLSEHYNIIHRMNVCPVCDQLFDNTLPPRFLVIHVNEHFNN